MNSEDSVVVSAPSVDEAISLGLIKLTALRDEVKIEILDEGNRGFLGLGAREAKVKVTRLSEEERRSAEERSQSQALEEVTEPETDIPSSPAESRERAERDVEPEPVAVSPRPEPTEKTPKVSEKPSQPESVSKPEPAEPQEFEKETPEDTKPRMPETVGGVKRAELEAVARDVAAGLLQDLDVDVTLEWLREDRPTLWIAVDGKDASALVGSRARTLHSLQYLFRALIYHRLDGDYNLVVDADSYRKRRRQSLENLAKRQAKKAIETGETVRLRPMPANERRIVHITLRDDDRVTTESVGHGRNRLVTIIPQRARSSS